MPESVKEQIAASRTEDQRQEVLKEFSKNLPIQLRTHLQGIIFFHYASFFDNLAFYVQ